MTVPRTALIILLILVMGPLPGCTGRREGAFLAMGGIPVKVVAHDRSRTSFANDLSAVESYVSSMEDVFSTYRKNSGISAINSVGKGCSEDVSPALIDILKRARHWSEASDGAFDVTVGPLIDLWRKAAKEGTLPSAHDSTRARSRIGMRHVMIRGNDVCLERENMRLDLGGIAKGAILDGAAQLLRRDSVARGLVEAGGDVAAFGTGTFTIGIQNPRAGRQAALLGVLAIDEGGVVTSGDYERYVVIEGKQYSHIIDPRTGIPVKGLVSVTVVGPNATDADALATAISVLGRTKGIELIKSLKDYKAIIVERDADDSFTVWHSKELTDALSLHGRWRKRTRTF